MFEKIIKKKYKRNTVNEKKKKGNIIKIIIFSLSWSICIELIFGSYTNQ